MTRRAASETAWTVETHEPVEHPTWECDQCGQRLGDRGEYDHEGVGEWRYCPWCKSPLNSAKEQTP